MEQGKVVYQSKTKTGKEIVIRYPCQSDALMMQKYINELSKEQTFIRFQGEQLTLQEETDFLTKELEKINKHASVYLLVMHVNEMIGSCDIDLDEKVHSHVGIFGISVKKEFRGEGIGKILMENVIQEAKKCITGLKIIRLGCFATNTKACEMYKSFGFTEFGLLPGGVMYQGKQEDYIEMYRRL
jgi:ribosomal protein S18 acetylase RimI-like enzyme